MDLKKILFSDNNIKLDQVQLINIILKVCDILKIKKSVSFEGQSLWRIINGKQTTLRTAFSEHQEKANEAKDGTWLYTRFSVRFDGWKLIYTLNPDDKTYELYNLKDDPNELVDLAGTEKKQFRLLNRKLTAWMKRSKPTINPLAVPLDKETKDKLRSLGYLQ